MKNTLPDLEKKSGTILFVDDEPLSLKYFKASVGRYANVRTASSADAAMEILAAEGDTISVVVSDERMPRESGVSFLSDVRKAWPSTVRVLTSAYANIDNLQHAINDAGIYRFVPKPWNMDELCAAMQDALHVERSAAELTEPLIGPATGGDAQEANLALLAILAEGLEAPLASIDTEALQLSQLGGQSTIEPPSVAGSFISSWSFRLRQAKISSAATQMRRDVEHSKALANSIRNLARSLANPATIPATSMSDTLFEVLEQTWASGLEVPVIDARHDFPHRVPREIMKFVLANLLRGGPVRRQSGVVSFSRIRLFAGADHNEIRFTVASGAANDTVALEHQDWRTVRSALWAFGGELLAATDEEMGSPMLIVCLPKAT